MWRRAQRNCGSCNHTAEMDVDQTNTEEGFLCRRETSLDWNTQGQRRRGRPRRWWVGNDRAGKAWIDLCVVAWKKFPLTLLRGSPIVRSGEAENWLHFTSFHFISRDLLPYNYIPNIINFRIYKNIILPAMFCMVVKIGLPNSTKNVRWGFWWIN